MPTTHFCPTPTIVPSYFTTMKRHLVHLGCAAVLLLGIPTSMAQVPASAEPPDNLRAVIEVLRSDVNTFKIATLNEALRLTGPEAELFWPVYRAYEKELAAVADRKIALLREFGEHHARGTLDGRAADQIARRWLRNVEDRLDLWKKYHKRLAKAVSPARAAQFLQVEHQMALFIDLSIAAEMPTLRTVTTKDAP
jgi:hypothetical protein